MNQQNKYLLPDKSFWQALNRGQRDTLSSKYTILCPLILLAEFARHEVNTYYHLLNLENIVSVVHWSEHAKMDLLTGESSKPMFFGSPSGGKSIRECTEQDLLVLKELSGKIIEALIESENNFKKGLDSAIDPWKEELLGLVNNTENLKAFMRKYLSDHPNIEHILKEIDAENFHQERKKRLKAVVERLCDRFRADSLANAYYLATTLLNHDPIDRSNALNKLQWLCGLFDSMLTQEEHTQIFNRFMSEDMPPIRKFAPYALGAVVWYFTIHLYLRENHKNIAPPNILRDAQYLMYTYYKNILFVSGDKWHRKFINEVPLFENIRENFVFVDLTTKATIQAEFSKLL